MSYLEVEHVTKQYAGHLALDKVSLTVPGNSIYGLLGPNGAGKTTLIRIINGITAPDSGTITLNGQQLRNTDISRMGYLPEERGLYRKMKVGEQALYLARLKGMSKQDAQKALRYWFEKFGIENWWNKKIEELSKGMAQKVQFITTVIHQPELIIFDEPFSGFDPVNADLLKTEILELREKGATIIFSTHNMATVEDLCENISLINNARIVLQGNVHEIRQAHSSGSYRIKHSSPLTPDNFEIINQTTEGNQFISLIRKSIHQTNNELLSGLMMQTSLSSFEELLPDMSDIFIKTVQQKEI